MVDSIIFLLLNRHYPALFATHIGRVARYTPSMTNKNVSDKLRFSAKANFQNPPKQIIVHVESQI